MNRYARSLSFLPLLSTVHLLAQDPGTRPLPSMPVPIHTADADLGVPYGTWAATDSYKVSFHDGMTFVPYLGADYPHNQPWSWRTTSVRLGELELLAPGVAPAHRHSEYRYEYDFGTVIEAYDVRADGLEQTFVVRDLPAAGDLVVTGAVTSALHAGDAGAAHRELVFADAAGTPIVTYGKAWAIDARGDRLAITTAFAAGAITLAVPGAWLAQAALPVVVDPLLTRNSVMASQPTIQSVDIGRDDEATIHTLLFAVTIAASQTDDDLRVIVTTDSSGAGVEVYADITSGWDSDGASCAFVGGANRWVIAFRRYFPTNPTRVSQLRAHVHDSGSVFSPGGVAALVPPNGRNDWRPDVGGVMSFRAGNQALVVFQRENNTATGGHWANLDDSQTWSVLFDATTTNGTFGAPVQLWGVLDLDSERPTVNQVAEGGAGFSWICAVQNYDHSIPSGDEWSVRARRIRNDGTLANSAWIASSSSTPWHQLSPVVEGMNGRYLVSWVHAHPPTLPGPTLVNRGRQIVCQRLDWLHTSTAAMTSPPRVTLVTGNDDIFELSGIAFDSDDRSHWSLGYRTVTTPVQAAFALRVGYRGQLTEGPVTLHSVAGQPASPVRCTYDAEFDRFLYAYGVNVSPTSRVWFHPFVYVTPGPLVTSGTNCHGAATLGWNGNRQIGAEFNGLTVSGAFATDIHIVLVSLATLDQPIVHPLVSSGCHLLVDTLGPGYLGTLPLGFGVEGEWPLPLPESLLPATLYFQDWVFGAAGTLSSTARLEVPIVK